MNYIDALALRIAVQAGDGDDLSYFAMELYRHYAVLALAKGSQTTAEDVHNAWSAWRSGTDPTHRSLVPFDELTPDVQRKDDPYVAAIRAVAAEADLPDASTADVPRYLFEVTLEDGQTLLYADGREALELVARLWGARLDRLRGDDKHTYRLYFLIDDHYASLGFERTYRSMLAYTGWGYEAPVTARQR